MILLVVAALALAVVTLVQGSRGRLVCEPRDGRWRSPESVQRESRWAALEYVAGAATVVALVTNVVVLAVVGLVVAGAAYVMVMRERRRD